VIRPKSGEDPSSTSNSDNSAPLSGVSGVSGVRTPWSLLQLLDPLSTERKLKKADDYNATITPIAPVFVNGKDGSNSWRSISTRVVTLFQKQQDQGVPIWPHGTVRTNDEDLEMSSRLIITAKHL
jgi:hypothetical protein